MKMIVELVCEDEGVYSRWTHFSEWYRSVVFGESLEKIEERQPRSLTLELKTIALYSREVESLSGISVIQFHRHTEPQMSGGRVILTAAGDCRRETRRLKNSNWGGKNDNKENRIANRDIQLVIPGKKNVIRNGIMKKHKGQKYFQRTWIQTFLTPNDGETHVIGLGMMKQRKFSRSEEVKGPWDYPICTLMKTQILQILGL